MAVQQITNKKIVKYDTKNPNFNPDSLRTKPEKEVSGNVKEDEDVYGEKKHTYQPDNGNLQMNEMMTGIMNKLDGLSFLARIKREFDGNDFRILGPAAAPILKKNNRFIYQLLINTNNRKLLLQKTSEIREYITKQKKSSIRWSIDVDPIDLY